jgi:hypothetical protein
VVTLKMWAVMGLGPVAADVEKVEEEVLGCRWCKNRYIIQGFAE